MSKLSTNSFNRIVIGSRASPLALAQVEEVGRELRLHYPQLLVMRRIVETVGDRDRTTSLRSLGKTDFFTRELDEWVLEGICDVAIHSAKDLPEPLPVGLAVVAISRGVDCSDALVLRPGACIPSLPPHAVIATPSERREEAVRQLRSDLTFVDVRGTIGERLELLETGQVEGVVIATAALIRLQLMHLNMIILDGETVPLQGRLAAVARAHDDALEALFAPLDSR